MKTFFLISLSIFGTFLGCSETLTVENLDPVITAVGNPYNDNGVLRFDYTIDDFEGDDANVIFEVCEKNDTKCGYAIINTALSDPLERVTTTPKRTHVLHTIVWKYDCGRVSKTDGESLPSDKTTEYIVKLSLEGVAKEAKVSEAFTLEALNMDTNQECEK